MIYSYIKDKWLREKQHAVFNFMVECDSCAAAAVLSRTDQKRLQDLCRTILDVMEKYAKN